MSDRQHKAQLQVVEGSATGEFHVDHKFAYDCNHQVEYIGECKVGDHDDQNKHYIQKMVYNNFLSLERVLIASNVATTNSTEISIEVIDSKKFKITTLDGDFKEVERTTIGGGKKKALNELTALSLNISGNITTGSIIKVSENRDEVVVESIDDISLTNVNNLIINDSDLLLTFKSENKPYEKRRWSNRERYIYKTEVES